MGDTAPRELRGVRVPPSRTVFNLTLFSHLRLG
jgi:hypothetical protein